jgi:hypothetical protein
MYIYNFLLRMTNTVTYQSTDLSSWDTQYTIALLMSYNCLLYHTLLKSVKFKFIVSLIPIFAFNWNEAGGGKNSILSFRQK